jgi:hypothetical protein
VAVARPGAHGCKTQLDKICASLPETRQRPGGEHGRHVAFVVRAKTFAYFTDDHHGDGRLALICRAAPGEQGALIASDADRFFVPPYLGHRGWVGLFLDRTRVDWTEVRELMIDAYRLAAPKRLAAQVD